MNTCDVCGVDNSLKVVFKKNSIPIYKCDSCGVGFCRCDDFDLTDYYDADYFNGGKNDGYSSYTSSADVLRSHFTKDIQLLKECGIDSGHLIEIGCAYGYFLDVAHNYFNVSGLEICSEAVSYCNKKGFSNVKHGVISKGSLDAFDDANSIVLLDVIEHLPNPHEALQEISSKLVPGGLLLLTTGDFSSLCARILGKQWRLMTPPQHLWFYTPAALKLLCESFNLELVKVDYPWKTVPLGLIVFQLLRYLRVKPVLPEWAHSFGIPVNLFDAMRIVFRKKVC
jgi:SAM-dependent methyltransferase